MLNRKLESFAPTVYRNVVEMSKLLEAEEALLDTARTEMSTAFANTFVLTANEDGVIMFERILNITPDPTTESVEFRRQRILNRMTMSPPFTFRFLKQKLDSIIGEGKWDAYIDFDSYTIYVEFSVLDANWYTELAFTMTQLKPCNMVFINVPRSSQFITASEEISYGTRVYNYLLGNWLLGAESFAGEEDKGVLKLASTSSIEQTLLNHTAEYLQTEEFASVRLNGTKLVPQLIIRRQDNVVTLEYEVTPKICSTINRIEIIDSVGNTLTDAAVYVPVTETVICKNTITIKEGS